jgi:16S rRNA (uracil1498-N3)-methyltransferase
MKQSQRSFLPVIHEPLSFARLIERFQRFERVVVCHEKSSAGISLVELLSSSPVAASTLILVGPEGGFSEDEVRVAADASAVAVSLGETRLRAETAALAALVLAVSLAP